MAVGVMRTSAGVEGVVVDALLAWTKAISEEGYLENCVQLGEWGMMFLGGVGHWDSVHGVSATIGVGKMWFGLPLPLAEGGADFLAAVWWSRSLSGCQCP